jgi:surface antigen/LysM repeat protein
MHTHRKNHILTWIKTSVSYIILTIFLVACLQPQYFTIDYQPTSTRFAWVYANFFSDEPKIPAIVLENMIVGDDGSSSLLYAIKAGDTLDSIARSYGITIETLRKNNNYLTNEDLKAGQKLSISFDAWVMVLTKQAMTVNEFVKTYNLSLNDIMSLNYFESADEMLVQEQELFVNLTPKEAESRWLIDKAPYQSPFAWWEEDVWASIDPTEEETYVDPYADVDINAVQQVVISAQDSALQIAKQNQKILTAEYIDHSPICGPGMCLFNDECFFRPENAYCIKNDMQHMRKCKEWFTQQWDSCIKPAVATRPNGQAAAWSSARTNTRSSGRASSNAKVDAKLISSGYFNPRADGAPNDGWAWWHCTHFAHWYWWKHYGINSMGFRGNAKLRWTNAKKAWRKVNNTPAIWAIWVGADVGTWSGYGHVFVVVGIDGDKIRIREMNYSGRYIVTERWVSTSTVFSFIHPEKVK